MTDLPYVKQLKSAHSCRVCRRWLEGEWADASPEQRVEIQRQMDVGRCDDCTRRKAADLAAAASVPDPGGPEDWPSALGGMGRVWAVRTLPSALGRPLVFVRVDPPAQLAGATAQVTVYEPAAFRALVAKMQQVADSLPPEPVRYRLLTIEGTPLDPGEYRQLRGGRYLLACARCGERFEVDSVEGDDPAPPHPCRSREELT